LCCTTWAKRAAARSAATARASSRGCAAATAHNAAAAVVRCRVSAAVQRCCRRRRRPPAQQLFCGRRRLCRQRHWAAGMACGTSLRWPRHAVGAVVDAAGCWIRGGTSGVALPSRCGRRPRPALRPLCRRWRHVHCCIAASLLLSSPELLPRVLTVELCGVRAADPCAAPVGVQAHQQAAEEGVACLRRLAVRQVRAPAHRARLLDRGAEDREEGAEGGAQGGCCCLIRATQRKAWFLEIESGGDVDCPFGTWGAGAQACKGSPASSFCRRRGVE